MRARWLLVSLLLLQWTPFAWGQQWYSVQSDHLVAYSEGNDRGAREVALRGERLIALYSQIFHRKDIVLTKTLRVRTLSGQHDVLVRTPMADFVTADMSRTESWTQAAKSIAGLLLEGNYPRAQPWFDLGITSYLANAQFTGEQMRLGATPVGTSAPQQWIPFERLFRVTNESQLTGAERAAFEFESWALVRWLIDNSRLAQAGAYLNAVQSRGATPERGVSEAFSMDFADLDREVRESLATMKPKEMPAPRVESNLFRSQKVSAADVHVLNASLSLFGPQSDAKLKELVQFMRENQENVLVHRALAWAFMLKHDQEDAIEHIRRALALEDSDASMHYLYARWVNKGDDDKINVQSAQTRMGTELKLALNRDPNYAPALELLGLAQLSDDALKQATTSLQRASALRPRNDLYYLNLARAYEAAGNLDAARNLILYAKAGGDRAVESKATELLKDLGKRKKQENQWAAMGLHADTSAEASATHTKYDNLHEAIEAEEKEEAQAKSAAQHEKQDSRKIQFLKGKIVSVQCGTAEDAELTVRSGGQSWHMHVPERNTVVLMGVDHFDCGWRGTAVSINYKQNGPLRGDVVSLEID